MRKAVVTRLSFPPPTLSESLGNSVYNICIVDVAQEENYGT